jgi:hypothetical protein
MMTMHVGWFLASARVQRASLSAEIAICVLRSAVRRRALQKRRFDGRQHHQRDPTRRFCRDRLAQSVLSLQRCSLFRHCPATINRGRPVLLPDGDLLVVLLRSAAFQWSVES